MSTQMQDAKSGIITDEMKAIAKIENVAPQMILDGVSAGRIVILKNNKRTDTIPVAIGEGLKAKVSACLNSLNKNTSLDVELDKLRVIKNAGADVVIDCSSNDLIDETRAAILSSSKIPVGTKPIVQVGFEALIKNNDLLLIEKHDFLLAIEKHCSDGADFICLNCSLTKDLLDRFLKQNRISKITDEGAIILASWMMENNCENPLYEYFDEILEIVKPYDVTLLLSSAFKAGSTNDASDRIEVAEQIIIGELVKRAREKDIQVMVEGVEFASLNKIPLMIQNIKELTDFAPLYVAGAIACDSAFGYDNFSNAIGSALAVYQGADMLKAISSTDRIGISKPAQIKEAIMGAKIAAHCGDLAKGQIDVVKQNYKVSFAGYNSDFNKQVENSLDKTVFSGVIDREESLFEQLYDKYLK